MKEKDDNIWSDYTKEYMRQIIENYRDGKGLFLDDIGMMDKYVIGIYDVIEELNPKSILECGCGGCYNIKNLRTILPEAEVHGFDVSEEQLSFGMWFCDIGWDGLSIMDITKDYPDRTYELVFTNAVIMHLSTDNAIKALKNMKRMTSKYILLQENPEHHGGVDEWMRMIKGVYPNWTIKTNEEIILLQKQ